MKPTDIKLITTEQKSKNLLGTPHCMGFKIFDEQLLGVEMRKINTLIKNTFYVGLAFWNCRNCIFTGSSTITS